MKNFADCLKGHVSIITNYEQKKIIKPAKEDYENHKNQKICYICNKEFSSYDDGKNYCKVILLVSTKVLVIKFVDLSVNH